MGNRRMITSDTLDGLSRITRGGDRMNRAEQFYNRLHQALGLTVETNDSLATMTEAVIMHTLQAGYHCLQEQQRAEAERETQLSEVVR